MNRDRMTGGLLIAGALMMIVTMALHPSPRGLEDIIRSTGIIVGTHSLALASLPVMLLGVLGLSRRLSWDELTALPAFVIYAFGSAAVLCAGVLNGLAVPMFVAHYVDAGASELEMARAVLRYNHSLNGSFTHVFMVATCAAILLWALAILKTRALPGWTGVLGIVVALAGLVGLYAGFVGISVHGFGLFVFGYCSWIILVGILFCLRRPKSET